MREFNSPSYRLFDLAELLDQIDHTRIKVTLPNGKTLNCFSQNEVVEVLEDYPNHKIRFDSPGHLTIVYEDPLLEIAYQIIL